MALRTRLAKLEQDARARLAFLDLPDGTRYYFDPQAIRVQLFLFAAQSIRADLRGEELPPVPEALQMLASLPAREEREKGFRLIYGPVKHPFVYYDVERFFGTGEIVLLECRSKREHSDPPGENTEEVIVVEPQR